MKLIVEFLQANKKIGLQELPVIISIFIFCSCAKEIRYVDFNEAELIRLISGDSIKSWTRISHMEEGQEGNLNECNLKLVYVFNSGNDNPDLRTFEVRNNPSICQSPDTVLIGGHWIIDDEITGKDTEDTLRFIIGTDTTSYGVNKITSISMDLTGKVGGHRVEDEFIMKE